MGVPISIRQEVTAEMISETGMFAQASMVLERSMSPKACRIYQYMHENLQAIRAQNCSIIPKSIESIVSQKPTSFILVMARTGHDGDGRVFNNCQHQIMYILSPH